VAPAKTKHRKHANPPIIDGVKRCRTNLPVVDDVKRDSLGASVAVEHALLLHDVGVTDAEIMRRVVGADAATIATILIEAKASRTPPPFKGWRKQAKLSLRHVAKAMGIAPSTVNRIENGQRPCSQEFIEAYARVLKVDPLALQFPKEEDAQQFSRMLDIWKRLKSAQRERALKLLDAAFG
jgi:transcriptional regulator with XRE-family HTH domain